MANEYCMFKGKLAFGVPYLQGYNGNPHYGVVVKGTDEEEFIVLVNVKSDSTMPGAAEAGYHVLYFWDQYFTHPMTSDLDTLDYGLHESGFPVLDYVHDTRLFPCLSGMRPIALDTAGTQGSSDINGLVDSMLSLDRDAEPLDYLYHGKSGPDHRKGWRPTKDVTVYGFGFLFQPQKDGLHETHMNQGNPRIQGGHDHSRENGIHQDGGLIIEVDGKFQALLIAFQTQLIPTDNLGRPYRGSHPILPRPQ